MNTDSQVHAVSSTEPLEIIYQDEHLVAINKPHGLLVHRSPIAADASEFALQRLRDQLDCPVYPAHRLDRKTGGLLLFAFSPEVDVQLKTAFAERRIAKSYLAIVRGYAPEAGTLDYALRNERGQVQEAQTTYQSLAQAELAVPFGKHETSRYSLMRLQPHTGRYHQLRKHMAHLRHPIIGDRPHGCNKQNRLFKERWQMDTMLLHAQSLQFEHPLSDEQIVLHAPLQAEFCRMMALMGWDLTTATK